MPLSNRGLKTLIFRITHYRNLDFTLQYGLFCPNSNKANKNYINIGIEQLIRDRGNTDVKVDPFGVLNDYVPFYFAPRSPMLYSISKGNVPNFKGKQSDIIYIVSTIETIHKNNLKFAFTNRHAFVAYSNHFNKIDDLENIDWEIMNAKYWNNTADDNDRMTRRMAEFLVYHFVPVNCILAIATYNQKVLDYVNQLKKEFNLDIDCGIKSDWYF